MSDDSSCENFQIWQTTYLRIYVMYGLQITRAHWPYMGIVTICWIILSEITPCQFLLVNEIILLLKKNLFFSLFKVPEYDVRTPHQTDVNGRTLPRFRRRRSVDHPDVLHYNLHAFDSKLQLRLKRNLNLMAPNLVIERHNREGVVTTHPAPRNKYYLGKVKSDPDSLVALRSDRGLVRAFTTLNIKHWTLNIEHWRGLGGGVRESTVN